MLDTAKLRELYISEAEDNIQKLESNLLAFEKDESQKKLLDELMRSAHTMKGSSAAMEYKNMAYLTHIMEDVFDYLRNGVLETKQEIFTQLLAAVDVLKKSLTMVKKEGKELDLSVACINLKKTTGVTTEGIGKSIRTANGKPIVANTKTETTPQDNQISPHNKFNADFEVEKISSIKVPVERLDKLMNLSEEILADKMKLEQIRDKDPDLKVLIEHLGRLVSDLQYRVMEVRLIPLDEIFARFPRMVRDLSQSLKKEVTLEIQGGEIELDRSVVDKLGEPLVHLVRNAIDHGIDKNGKIILKAIRTKDFAQIIVEDDGQGINFDKVREVAIKKNIVPAKDIESYDKVKLIDLLFNSRLSTNNAVTETSGRGIGLSVVKSFVESLGGKTMVDTLEKGTRFTLQLPQTLAIVDALLVEVGKELYAIPFSGIEHSVRIPTTDIKKMLDKEIAVIEGRDIPLFFPRIKFGTDDSKEITLNTTIVLVKKIDETVGVVVDNLVARQEIIVKPLPAILKNAKGFSGSTILGDGKTILIIDPVSLFN